jgi:UDP-2,4-diacetamido-2,4,6-trideoxy-beta-L-altropyranose hydrolase
MGYKAIFRFEASPTIGSGHAVRSMVLAHKLKELNWDIRIATKVETYDFITYLKCFERIDPPNLIDREYACDILVIDSYEIDQELESQFRCFTNKIIVIDDLANRYHDCDILIDQTYGRLASDYQHLVPKGCQILTGSDFALIRDGFLKYRFKGIDKRKNSYKINKILISLGGSCQKELIQKILEKLIEAGYDGEIDIVVGFLDDLNRGLLNHIKSLPNIINTHINPDMAKLMFEADFAITASGSSVWERCCLGLSGIIVQVAENQKNIYKKLIEDKLFAPIENLSDQLNDRKKNHVALFNLCDGKGKDRLIQFIKKLYV